MGLREGAETARRDHNEVRYVRKVEGVDRRGGASYLFAVVIDCGKGLARQSWPIVASEKFLALVKKTLGQSFYQVGDES